MFLALLLFLNGIAAQQQQTETTDQLLAKLLAPRIGCATQAIADTYMNSISRDFQTLEDKLESVILAANGFNQMLNQLVEENKTLRNRQAAAAVISVCQLLIVIIYLLVIGVIYIVKCFKVQQAKQLEQNLQEMEERLQERKSKRRSAGRLPKEQ